LTHKNYKRLSEDTVLRFVNLTNQIQVSALLSLEHADNIRASLDHTLLVRFDIIAKPKFHIHVFTLTHFRSFKGKGFKR